MNIYDKWQKWTELFDYIQALPASELNVALFAVDHFNGTGSKVFLKQLIPALKWVHSLSSLEFVADSPLLDKS